MNKHENNVISIENSKASINYRKKNRVNNNDIVEEFPSLRVGNMDLDVHNKLNINYGKVVNSIIYFVKASLGKFAKKNNWKLEVWLDENNKAKHTAISCGIALKRDNKHTIYAKKVEASLNKAVVKSLGVLSKSIRRESKRWERADFHQLIS